MDQAANSYGIDIDISDYLAFPEGFDILHDWYYLYIIMWKIGLCLILVNSIYEYTAYWSPRYYDVIMSANASQITSIASWLFTQRFIHVQIKGNTKAPHHWSLYIYIYIQIYTNTCVHACVWVWVWICVCVWGGGGRCNILLRKAADALTSF